MLELRLRWRLCCWLLLQPCLGRSISRRRVKHRRFSGLLDSVIEAAEDDEVSEKEFQKVVASAKRLVSAEA